ncbi:MAG: UvrD-helicase domain-containing protein, partial [Verrucomicrobiota bacterium]
PLGALDDTFEAEGPLLSQVQGLDWKKRIRHRRLAKRLLSIEAPVEVEELHECLDLLQSRDPQLAELITEVFFYLMDHRRDQAQLTVDRYAAEKSNAESQTAGIPDEWAQATDSEEVVVLEQLTESALDRILEPGNFQNWMQFLHPDQQKRVDEDHGHPIVLRGVSGSGKTVVVVHRARRLARAFPNARVVVLTLHHDLAILLNDLVDLLAGDDDLANLRVYSLAGYFRTILRSIGHEAAFRDWGQYLFGEEEGQALGRDYALRSEDQVFTPQPDWVYQNLFQDFLTENEEEYAAEWELIRKAVERRADPARYLREEVDFVRSVASSLVGYDSYLEVERKGRSIPFGRRAREAMLTLTKAWERYQWKREIFDPHTLSQMVFRMAEAQGALPPEVRCEHLLIDEFQDLSTLEADFLAQVTTERENGFFLSGDEAQRVRVKSLRLGQTSLGDPSYRRFITKNYRNTREILEAGMALLGTIQGQFEDQEFVEPSYSSRR